MNISIATHQVTTGQIGDIHVFRVLKNPDKAQCMVGGTYPLRSRRIMLTGASRGLGRALAAAFQQAGADLLLIARPSAAFDTLSAELEAAKFPFQSIVETRLDLTEIKAAAAITRQYAPHVLVNNAAIQGPIGPIWQLDPTEWRRTLDVDLLGPAALMAAAIPAMIERGQGVVINLSGGGATRSRPGFSAYAAAKSALVRLTETVADEVRPYGIAITAVAPGALPTRMLQEIVATGDAGAEEIAASSRTLAQPIEAHETAFRLVSDFCVYLAERPRLELSGRLIAPRWDSWRDADDLAPEIFKLRRVER